ncbi:unnamed protein product [Musa textilis]
MANLLFCLECWKMKLPFVVIFSLGSLLGSLAQQCGPAAGGKTCLDGLCCSQYGYCGSTFAYCNDSGYQCGTQAAGGVCPAWQCCSQHGYCGNTSDYCGSGCQSQCDGGSGSGDSDAQCGSQAAGALCPDGQCCSQYGYCGTTSDYCGVSQISTTWTHKEFASISISVMLCG